MGKGYPANLSNLPEIAGSKSFCKTRPNEKQNKLSPGPVRHPFASSRSEPSKLFIPHRFQVFLPKRFYGIRLA